ncbi:MAG TPA: PVC-type heme-binding CxxCH protein [Planctomycetota bacterium]|nr:PVC-type heme-binding CxxCH protein [Planctomycetota bacterium]
MKNTLLLLCVLTLSLPAWAGGDKPGEEQPPPKITLPPSPPLSPDEALKSFKLQNGFRLELVASEPLIHDPVAIAFDEDGRIWVAEFRSYMPNVDGTGEDENIGSIAILEDTDGNGKMDKRTEFLDGINLPRAIGFVKGGVLVAHVVPPAVQPQLFLCRDTNGDGKCDEKTLIASDYGPAANPEHTANGLLSGLDNWIYSAGCTSRFRPMYRVPDGGVPTMPAPGNPSSLPPLKGVPGTAEYFLRERTNGRGQWGITQDSFGRMFYNTNSDFLRGDLIPTHYYGRNANFKGTAGVNVQIMKDQSTWPGRPNPGVNRGYRSGQLREDSTLATCTATCGISIFRGTALPDDCIGNAFLPEPSANMIKRVTVSEDGLSLVAKNVYEKTEFLTSTDERFRPVNTYTGPDGALYIVDLYRGILQHKVFVTTYLRKQILERGLDKHLGLGRIYRVVGEGKTPLPVQKMSKMTAVELVAQLSSPNGWTRDTAQRLLVERNDKTALPELKKLVTEGSNPVSKIHALWTLEGMEKLTPPVVTAALADKDAKVRATAIRVSEVFFGTQLIADLLPKILELANDSDPQVQVQLAFTLGGTSDARATAVLQKLLLSSGSNTILAEAVQSSLGGRELEMIETIVADDKAPNADKLLGGLAKAVFAEGRGARVVKLLDIIAAQPPAQQAAMLEIGAGSGGKDKKDAKGVPLRIRDIKVGNAEPPGLAKLLASSDKKVAERAKAVSNFIVWNGKPGTKPHVPPPALTAAQQERFELGKKHYTLICAACHQPNGMGEEGKAPPLIDSPFALGSEGRLARIVINGLRGPVTVHGKTWNMEMPGLPTLDDNTVAAILTYIRREWEHEASPVEPETIKKIREEVGKREDQWTEKELLQIK